MHFLIYDKPYLLRSFNIIKCSIVSQFTYADVYLFNCYVTFYFLVVVIGLIVTESAYDLETLSFKL